MSDPEPTLKELFDDGRAIDEALREAARDARRLHKALGNPMATWKDGRSEDVTATAQYDSLNAAVADVTPTGLITAKDRGETHIMVRFGGQATVTQVTLPYAKLESYPAVAKNNFIDEKLVQKWKGLGLTPSATCSDEEFLRRIHLDTIGTLPLRHAPGTATRWSDNPVTM